MKLFSILAMLTLPMIACANGFTVKEPNASPASINMLIEQKAQASGVTFVSNNQQYQLISGGLGVKQNMGNGSGSSSKGVSSLTSVTSPRVSSSNLGPSLWQGKKAGFKLFIIDEESIALVASASVSGITNNYYQIGYNSSTKAIAIICGNIIVTYNKYASPELIAQTFNINLVDHFPDMKVAIFSMPSWGDIFTTTDSINQSGLVVQAEIVVLENESVPL